MSKQLQALEVNRRGALKVGIGALASLAVGETILLHPGEAAAQPARPPRRPNVRGTPKVPHNYKRARKITSVCLNCSTVCGIVGYVDNGKLIKIGGNPEDPNNGKMLCAKGQAGVVISTYPERLLYPLKRVGRRGQGTWRRITWEEAYADIAKRVRACIDAGHPEHVAIHIGRSRLADIMGRFLNAIGSPVLLNHRALCSLNKRAANYATIGDVDWESVDAERCKYLLNFGSNFYEAHQGAIHFLKRVIKGRYDNGCKLVTFDVRLSNTAGRSDEWHAPFPGTEGAVALALANTIVADGNFDRDFMTTWTNTTVDALSAFLKPYTPEWAEKLSGISAGDIRRIARAFIRERPRCAAFTNRGSHAHYNGFNNDRAVILLNALAGSINQPGGYCYAESAEIPDHLFPMPAPVPAAPKIRTDLEDPPEWPLANRWQKMRVGQIVYAYLKQKRARLQVYFTYTLASPTTWPEGRSLAVEVLRDEKLIPFHVCSDVVYSETAHYADLILPDATYLERWGLDARNNYELRTYATLRQPLVPPPAECVNFADVLIQVGKRLGPEVSRYFDFRNYEDFVRLRCRQLPKGDSADGFAYMKRHGVYHNTSEPRSYDLFKRPLTKAQLDGSRTDPQTGIISKRNARGVEEAIGITMNAQALRGFKTPSRKFEVHSQTVAQAAARVKIDDDGWPHYVPIPAHQNLPEDRFILTTFKWNVHTQGRTAPQKYLTEIVHDNPMWINAATARRLGIRTGDTVEVTTYRPRGRTFDPTGQRIGSARIRAFVTEGIHPRVFAVSNSLGHLFGGRSAAARRGPRAEGPGFDPKILSEDADLTTNLWWSQADGGKGAGFNVNAILPIQPAPITGMQAWFDTVCSIRKV
ncbi:MAG: molybdopterin-dependent oxidoreductase [Gemmataceae bacterium]|nr:molybdopterin-dependent oxidoreductase [Gemmataceae bacterium]